MLFRIDKVRPEPGDHRLMEGNMKPCNACRELAGQPSGSPPHENLRREGTGVFGTPREPIRRYVRYRCGVCGSWLRQNTAYGSPAEVWSVQGPGGQPAPACGAEPHESESRPEHASRGIDWLKTTLESAQRPG